MSTCYLRVKCGLDPQAVFPRESVKLPIRPCTWTGIIYLPEEIVGTPQLPIFCPQCGYKLRDRCHYSAITNPIEQDLSEATPWLDYKRLYLLISKGSAPPRWLVYREQIQETGVLQGVMSWHASGAYFEEITEEFVVWDRLVAKSDQELATALAKKMPKFMVEGSYTDVIPVPELYAEKNFHNWLVFINGLLRLDCALAMKPIITKSSVDITRAGERLVMRFSERVPNDYKLHIVDMLSQKRWTFENGAWRSHCD
jgi:hypothetical protein